MSFLSRLQSSRTIADPKKGMDPALREEVDQPPAWMYAWELGESITTPVLGPELSDVHRTRLELLEAPVREVLSSAGPDARVIDLACNEGWFSHRLLEWGASYVLGVDVRPRVIRRAELLRAHLGIPQDRLELRCADVFDLNVSELGMFDVVLCLGLVYHLENPVGAMRIARVLTGGICVIESQLTRQNEPIMLGNGRSDIYEESPASYGARVETDWENNMLASAGGVVSLTPNRAALLQAAGAAGFAKLEVAQASPEHNRQYVLGDRAVLLAWPVDLSASPSS
jgi:SAM-dependent methyltransferase